MNSTESKLIILLSQIPSPNRNIHFLAAKLGKSFSATYNYLKILEANSHVTRRKTANNKSFYETNEESVKKAIENVSSKNTEHKSN